MKKSSIKAVTDCKNQRAFTIATKLYLKLFPNIFDNEIAILLLTQARSIASKSLIKIRKIAAAVVKEVTIELIVEQEEPLFRFICIS